MMVAVACIIPTTSPLPTRGAIRVPTANLFSITFDSANGCSPESRPFLGLSGRALALLCQHTTTRGTLATRSVHTPKDSGPLADITHVHKDVYK